MNNEDASKLKYLMQSGTSSAIAEFMTEWEHRLAEDILRSLPTVVRGLVLHTATVKETSDKFYKAHPELVDKKDLVAQVMEEVESRNPGISFEKLMQEVGKQTTNRLRGFKSTDSGRPTLETLDDNLQRMLP